jgi:hypothetical protein
MKLAVMDPAKRDGELITRPFIGAGAFLRGEQFYTDAIGG